MKTRTRADSLAGPRLNLTWDTDVAQTGSAISPNEEPLGELPDNSSEEAQSMQEQLPLSKTPDAPQETGSSAPGLNSQSEDQAQSVPSAMENGSDPEQPAPAPQEEPAPVTPPSPVHPRRTSSTVDLTRRIEQVGPTLRRFRENLGLTVEELSKKTLIPRLSIQHLEQGSYAEMEELIYCKRHLSLLCRELGIDSADSEQLETLLEKEYAKAGREIQNTPEIKTLEPSWTAEEVAKGRRLSWFQRLPSILLTLGVIIAVILLVVMVVIPMVKGRDTTGSQHQDWAPLIPVTPPQPIQLQIPGK